MYHNIHPFYESLTLLAVFPCGSHTSPGAQAGVPVIIPTEITVHILFVQLTECLLCKQTGRESWLAGDGSRWRQAQWEGLEVTVREHNPGSKWTTAELMVLEMESLSVLRHPNILLVMATCCGPSKHDLLLVTEPVKTFSLFQLLHQFEDGATQFRSQRLNIARGITEGLRPSSVLI